MRFVPRKPLPHHVPAWVEGASLYFFTVCARPPGTTNLIRPESAKPILSATEHYHVSGRWHIRILLLMPDHLHALAAFPSIEEMRNVWRDWKRFTAKVARVEWQRDFFEHRLRNEESWEEKAAYIRANPVRKGLVTRPEDWRWVYPAP